MVRTIDDENAAFIAEYMIDFKASRAARACGMVPESADASQAGTAGFNMLRRTAVREEVDRQLAERRATNKITVAHIENMLRDMADVELLDIYDAQGGIRPLEDMPPHARRAIKSIKRRVKENYITGEEEVTLEVDLWDKKGAIELLGKYKKMFTEKIELGGELKSKVAFTINGVIK